MGEPEGTWVQRLHSLSATALEIWPPESPHWRVAGPLIVPQNLREQELVQMAVRSAAEPGDTVEANEGLGPEERATVLLGLSKLRGRLPRVAPLLNQLVDHQGVDGAHRDQGLASQLKPKDLVRCLEAMATSDAMVLEARKEGPFRDFAEQALKRLGLAPRSLDLKQLLSARRASEALSLPRAELTSEIRNRLVTASNVQPNLLKSKPSPAEDGEPSLSEKRETVAMITGAHALNEVGVLRSFHVREALMLDTLSVNDACELLRYAVPEKQGLSLAHEFVVAQCARVIERGARGLTPRQLASVARGVAALQASGSPFALQQAGTILRKVWRKVGTHLDFLGPQELKDILWAYWWQLLYSSQELGLHGETINHPLLPSLDEKSRGTHRELQAVEQLLSKLLRPTLQRLPEMNLKQVTSCLTTLAPPIRSPDVLTETDRLLVRNSVAALFAPEGASANEENSVVEEGSMFLEEWMKDYWTAEIQGLSTPEILELACGLREAGLGPGWPLNAILAETDRRLEPQGKLKGKQIELSHFLLLRLCRAMDMWHRHEVEEVLRSLLSNPEAVKPLPTAYFVAVLSAICSFLIPKELPLRLVSSFLDREQMGQHTVQPEQWAEILCAIRPLDEWPSYERITPRLIQHLLPHLQGLPANALLTVLKSLSAKPFSHVLQFEAPTAFGPLKRAPRSFSRAAAKAVQDGKWDLRQVVEAFSALSKLGFYEEAPVAQLLRFILDAPLLEPHTPLLVPLVKACTELHVHHAPLLQKVVTMYCWCYTYLWAKPLGTSKLDELLEMVEQLLELSFQSMELQGVVAENLTNPNATSRQKLAMLSVLARSSHFPPEFKEVCAEVCSKSSDAALSALSASDLVNTFNIHLCTVFDGPAALKHWMTEDAGMKSFFQVHTSQKWYQKQDQELAAFLQSPVCKTLRQAAEKEGLNLQNCEPGQVYHLEMVEADAKERLAALSETPPLAVICIKSKEQLRWYVPVTAQVEPNQDLAGQNRCHEFRFMFRGAVQKLRHVQTMGYRPCVIWLSEWNQLETEAARREYLRAAVSDYAAFTPSAVQADDIYR